jgi:hypothetical protein
MIPENLNEETDGGLPPRTGSVSSEPLHVYDWLDQPAADENERLAKEWLEQFVKPAIKKDHDWMDARVLTCEYRGTRYRCIGASRMGDVWLTSDMKARNGYEKRVNVEDLSAWQRVDSEAKPGKCLQRGMACDDEDACQRTEGHSGPHGYRDGSGGPVRMSTAADRHDPSRCKTREDLERMAAAQRKRDRKAARKGPPNDQVDLSGPPGGPNSKKDVMAG